jgi:hypothetical protein
VEANAKQKRESSFDLHPLADFLRNLDEIESRTYCMYMQERAAKTCTSHIRVFFFTRCDVFFVFFFFFFFFFFLGFAFKFPHAFHFRNFSDLIIFLILII